LWSFFPLSERFRSSSVTYIPILNCPQQFQLVKPNNTLGSANRIIVQTLRIVCCNRCTLFVPYCKNLSHLKQKGKQFSDAGHDNQVGILSISSHFIQQSPSQEDSTYSATQSNLPLPKPTVQPRVHKCLSTYPSPQQVHAHHLYLKSILILYITQQLGYELDCSAFESQHSGQFNLLYNGYRVSFRE